MTIQHPYTNPQAGPKQMGRGAHPGSSGLMLVLAGYDEIRVVTVFWESGARTSSPVRSTLGFEVTTGGHTLLKGWKHVRPGASTAFPQSHATSLVPCWVGLRPVGTVQDLCSWEQRRGRAEREGCRKTKWSFVLLSPESGGKKVAPRPLWKPNLFLLSIAVSGGGWGSHPPLLNLIETKRRPTSLWPRQPNNLL